MKMRDVAWQKSGPASKMSAATRIGGAVHVARAAGYGGVEGGRQLQLGGIHAAPRQPALRERRRFHQRAPISRGAVVERNSARRVEFLILSRRRYKMKTLHLVVPGLVFVAFTCATAAQVQQGPISRSSDQLDGQDTGSFETRGDDSVAYSIEPSSKRTTFYLEAVNRSAQSIVRYRTLLTTISSLRTTAIRDRILASAIPARGMTSRNVELTVLKDGTAKLNIAPGGRVAMAIENPKAKDKTFTYLPFAAGSVDVSVTSLTTFLGPDGKEYPAGSYEFTRGVLHPVNAR